MQDNIYQFDRTKLINRFYARYDQAARDKHMDITAVLNSDDYALLDDIKFLLAHPQTRQRTHDDLRELLAQASKELL